MKQVLRYLKQELWYGDDALRYPHDVKEDKYIQQGAVALIGFRWKGESKRSHLNSRIKNNKDLLLAAVKTNGYVLDYASKELKNDKEVVLAAVKTNGFALYYASARLQGDQEVVRAAVKNNGWALYCAAIRFRDNKEVVLTPIRNNPHALDYASDRLQDDRDIVKEACKMSALSFYFASRFIKSNRDLIKEEISLKNYEIFKYCHSSLRREKDIYLPVLKKDPSLCKLFSPNTLLKLDFSSLPKRNKEVIFESFEKRTKEKDLFVLAKAKKYILG